MCLTRLVIREGHELSSPVQSSLWLSHKLNHKLNQTRSFFHEFIHGSQPLKGGTVCLNRVCREPKKQLSKWEQLASHCSAVSGCLVETFENVMGLQKTALETVEQLEAFCCCRGYFVQCEVPLHFKEITQGRLCVCFCGSAQLFFWLLQETKNM